MRRARAIILCLAAVCLFAFSACSGCEKNGESAFVFLSVRLKGGGGTVTAYAQNEFALGSNVIPVKLELYFSEEKKSDVRDMEAVGNAASDDLDIFEKLETSANVGGGGYFCAVLRYALNGETRLLQSEILYYDEDGGRK